MKLNKSTSIQSKSNPIQPLKLLSTLNIEFNFIQENKKKLFHFSFSLLNSFLHTNVSVKSIQRKTILSTFMLRLSSARVSLLTTIYTRFYYRQETTTRQHFLRMSS